MGTRFISRAEAPDSRLSAMRKPMHEAEDIDSCSPVLSIVSPIAARLSLTINLHQQKSRRIPEIPSALVRAVT
jgi:hypothetical protein